jgi:hypothetical protein
VTALAEKLHDLTRDASADEIDNYKLLLCIAAGGLAPEGHPPVDGPEAAAFRTVVDCLGRIHPTGLLYRGRPDFMTDELLARLQAESDEVRKVAVRSDLYFLGCGGPTADALAVSGELRALVDQLAEGMEPTGIASYLFYDEPGCGLSPHVDTDVFTLNAILMLRHEHASESPSHLVLYSPEGEEERLLLEPGEIALLFAGGTVHAREPVKEDERIALLTLGFEPVAAAAA